MKISTTTLDFMVKKAWAQTPAEAVALFGKTNFKHLDFAFDFIDWEEGLPFYAPGDAWKKSIDAAMNEAQKHGIDFVVAHSLVDHEAIARGGEDRARSILQMKNTVAACGMLGIHDLVIHGFFYGKNRTEGYESNKRFFEEFSDALEKYDVNGLIENGFDAEGLLGAIEYAGNPRMHAVWDIGHANINNYPQYESIVKLGSHLHTIHVQDNLANGYSDRLQWHECDAHMAPFYGTVNFDEVMCGLIDSGYKGAFNLEAINALRPYDVYPWNPRRTWERDTRALNPSVELRVATEQFLYEIAKFILQSYDCYED